MNNKTTIITTRMTRGHEVGAGWYVIIVIVFYGCSVMLLIASHISRKHRKIVEDRQINSYLKEFQVVRERSSRENYRALKRNTIITLDRMGVPYTKKTVYKCLSNSLLSTAAVAFPHTNRLNILHNPHPQIFSFKNYGANALLDKRLTPAPLIRKHNYVENSKTSDSRERYKSINTLPKLKNSALNPTSIQKNQTLPVSLQTTSKKSFYVALDTKAHGNVTSGKQHISSV